MGEKIIKNLKVLHLLNFSLPKISGYSIRSHNILLYLKKFLTSLAITNPKFIRTVKPEVIDNVIYLRYPPDKVLDFLIRNNIFRILRIPGIYNIFYYSVFKIPSFYLRKLVDSYNINLIHSYSPEFFAKYGLKVARKKNIPFIYEIRGFVEDTLVGQGIIKIDSLKYWKRINR